MNIDTMILELEDFKVGDKVRFIKDLKLDNDEIIQKGEVFTINRVDNYGHSMGINDFYVTLGFMDEYCENISNRVEMYDDTVELVREEMSKNLLFRLKVENALFEYEIKLREGGADPFQCLEIMELDYFVYEYGKNYPFIQEFVEKKKLKIRKEDNRKRLIKMETDISDKSKELEKQILDYRADFGLSDDQLILLNALTIIRVDGWR